eukprot:scaffold152364_cov23-Cyclotella_meneghiniana.AAC.1
MFNVLAQGPSKTTGRSSLCIIRSEMSHENVLFTTEIYLFASTVRALQENKNGRNKEITIVSLASDSKLCSRPAGLIRNKEITISSRTGQLRETKNIQKPALRACSVLCPGKNREETKEITIEALASSYQYV